MSNSIHMSTRRAGAAWRTGLVAASLMLAGAAAMAADSSSTSSSGGPSGGPGGQPPGPPPEAIAACQGKAVGAAASFTGRKGETFSGTCQYATTTNQQGVSSQVLALRPDRMPAPPQGGQQQ